MSGARRTARWFASPGPRPTVPQSRRRPSPRTARNSPSCTPTAPSTSARIAADGSVMSATASVSTGLSPAALDWGLAVSDDGRRVGVAGALSPNNRTGRVVAVDTASGQTLRLGGERRVRGRLRDVAGRSPARLRVLRRCGSSGAGYPGGRRPVGPGGPRSPALHRPRRAPPSSGWRTRSARTANVSRSAGTG